MRTLPENVQQSLDGQWGAALIVVVHVDVRVHVVFQVLPDDLRRRLKPIVLGLDNLVPCTAGVLLNPGRVGAEAANDRE